MIKRIGIVLVSTLLLVGFLVATPSPSASEARDSGWGCGGPC